MNTTTSSIAEHHLSVEILLNDISQTNVLLKDLFLNRHMKTDNKHLKDAFELIDYMTKKITDNNFNWIHLSKPAERLPAIKYFIADIEVLINHYNRTMKIASNNLSEGSKYKKASITYNEKFVENDEFKTLMNQEGSDKSSIFKINKLLLMYLREFFTGIMIIKTKTDKIKFIKNNKLNKTLEKNYVAVKDKIKEFSNMTEQSMTDDEAIALIVSTQSKIFEITKKSLTELVEFLKNTGRERD